MKNISCASELATAQLKLAGEISPVTDKKGFGARWGFSVRHIDNWLRSGMPHVAIGKRRVRILIPEADQWVKEKFATRRNGPVNKAKQ